MLKSILLFGLIFLTFVTFSQIPSYVPSNGLVGWWAFNGNANDESGNGNHGNVNGATLTADRFGNLSCAYNFNGINNYIQTNAVNSLNSTSNSISLWLNAPVFSDHHQIEFASVSFGTLGKAFAFNTSRFALVPHTDCVNANTPGLYYLSGQFNVNNWHHLVFVSDSTVGKFYLNGSFLGQSIIGNPICQNELTLVLGRGTNGGGPMWYNGKLDDIGIWNRTLTECEIQNLYTSQLNVISQDISAGPDQNICSGDNVTLNGTGGYNYQWNNNVVDSQAFSPTLSNNYVVTAQDTLGCTGTDTVMVTVLENAANTLAEMALDSYTLNGQTYSQSGTYTQTLTAANGCDSVITLILNLNFTGINQSLNSAFCLFPNPASDQLIINANELFNGKPYAIYDQSGKMLLNGILNKPSTSISLSGFTNGFYIFKIEGQGISTFVVHKE